MKPLKAEIDAVVDVLDREPGELKDIASEVIQALDQVRAEQQIYPYALLFSEGPTLICVGPFRTIKTVEREAAKLGLSPDDACRVVYRHS